MPPNRPIVLVVDDDADARDVLSKALSRDGYAVITACDGEEALAMTEEWVPSLIVLDIRMPRMDGITFDRTRRRRPSTSLVPVVIVSASDDHASIIRAIRPAAYFPKPIDVDEIRNAVAELLHLPPRQKRH